MSSYYENRILTKNKIEKNKIFLHVYNNLSLNILDDKEIKICHHKIIQIAYIKLYHEFKHDQDLNKFKNSMMEYTKKIVQKSMKLNNEEQYKNLHSCIFIQSILLINNDEKQDMRFVCAIADVIFNENIINLELIKKCLTWYIKNKYTYIEKLIRCPIVKQCMFN